MAQDCGLQWRGRHVIGIGWALAEHGPWYTSWDDASVVEPCRNWHRRRSLVAWHVRSCQTALNRDLGALSSHYNCLISDRPRGSDASWAWGTIRSFSSSHARSHVDGPDSSACIPSHGSYHWWWPRMAAETSGLMNVWLVKWIAIVECNMYCKWASNGPDVHLWSVPLVPLPLPLWLCFRVLAKCTRRLSCAFVHTWQAPTQKSVQNMYDDVCEVMHWIFPCRGTTELNYSSHSASSTTKHSRAHSRIGGTCKA